MTAREHAQSVIERLLQKVLDEAKLAAGATTVDSVHDLRVAVRRFSQALRIFKDLLPPNSAKQVRKEVRALREEAGRLRDIDVIAELLEAHGFGPDSAVAAQLRTQRSGEEIRLKQALQTINLEESAVRWRGALHHPKPGSMSIYDYARKHLPKATTRYFATGRKLLARRRSAQEFHAFRIVTKRFRYTLEMFLPVFGPILATRVRTLQRMQGILGDAHDCMVAAETLVRYQARPQTVNRLRKDATAKEAAFAELWQSHMELPGEDKRWRRYFQRIPVRRATRRTQ